MWPKDPLEEQREMMRNTEMIEISDLMDAISRDQAQYPEKESGDIKQSLQRITATELKLSDMISRHIKKHGPVNFTNSQFVVTSRANNNLSQTGDYSTIKTPEKPEGQEDKSPANKQMAVIEN